MVPSDELLASIRNCTTLEKLEIIKQRPDSLNETSLEANREETKTILSIVNQLLSNLPRPDNIKKFAYEGETFDEFLQLNMTALGNVKQLDLIVKMSVYQVFDTLEKFPELSRLEIKSNIQAPSNAMILQLLEIVETQLSVFIFPSVIVRNRDGVEEVMQKLLELAWENKVQFDHLLMDSEFLTENPLVGLHRPVEFEDETVPQKPFFFNMGHGLYEIFSDLNEAKRKFLEKDMIEDTTSDEESFDLPSSSEYDDESEDWWINSILDV
jgi:hypothetical protein